MPPKGTQDLKNQQKSLISPAQNLVTITPSNTVDIITNSFVKAIYVGTTGDINILAVGDTTPVLLKNVPVGILPISAQRIFATSTTATDLVGLN